MTTQNLNSNSPTSVGFIGGGNMARSLVGGLLSNEFDRTSIVVSDQLAEARQHVAENYQVNVTNCNDEVVSNSSIVILAVKPQVMREVLEGLKETLQLNQPLLISIAAGIALRELDAWSGGNLAIVRVMPNTPALIQKGISALYANPQVTSMQMKLSESILSAVGKTVWLQEESALDAVTAVSGSGPAYFFYLIEAIQQAAEDLGLAADTARLLATETAVGAALLSECSSESPATLRKQVTSPGGTTEAALNVLESAGVKEKIIEAIVAAQRRAVEMSKATA